MHPPGTADGSAADFSVIDFLVDPASQFPRLAAHPRFAAPVAVLLAGTVGLTAFYYARLDYAWFTDHLIAAHPLVRRLGATGSLRLDAAMLLGPAVVSAALTSLLGWIAIALYVAFLGAASRRPLPLEPCLAVAAWVQVPYIAALVPSAVRVAMQGDGRLAPDQVDPTTFAMLFGLPADPLWPGLALHGSLADLWAWALLAIGLRSVLGLRWGTSIATVLGPMLLLKIGLAAASALDRM